MDTSLGLPSSVTKECGWLSACQPPLPRKHDPFPLVTAWCEAAVWTLPVFEGRVCSGLT